MSFEQPPQRHRKASDWVLGWLRDSIIGGRLPPGEQLPLVALAGQVGLSTTPIREALSRLRDEGLVVGDSHRTFRVAPLTLEDVRDYYLTHAFFCGVLAERAATSLTEDQLAELRRLDETMQKLDKKGDQQGVHERNFEFHRIINEGASDVLRRFVTLTTRLVSRRTYPDVEGWSHSIDDHAAILDAIEAHDGPKARAAMEQHIHNAGEAVLEDLRARGWNSSETASAGAGKS